MGTVRDVRIHVRDMFELNADHGKWLDAQIQAANDVFGKAGIAFVVASREQSFFGDGTCDVGECNLTGGPTAEQSALFGSVPASVPNDESVVFLAKALGEGVVGGCAWHPDGRLGCIVTAREDSSAPRYKLAHELGHVFKLPHAVNFIDRLMYPSVEWQPLPPILSPTEVGTLRGVGELPGPDSGEAPEPSGDRGPEEQVRFELHSIEPDLKRVLHRGRAVIQLLEAIYRESKDGEVKARVAWLLGQLVEWPDRSAVLGEAVRSPDVLIRIASAHGLKRTDQRRSKGLLEQLKRDPDSSVRRAVPWTASGRLLGRVWSLTIGRA